MSTAGNQLLNSLLQLPLDERGEIAAQLLDSLDTGADPDADSAWAEEIRTRVEDIRSGRVKSVPWSEARSQILTDGDGGS
jgi:putative addiction module component (TIGR02574 family)